MNVKSVIVKLLSITCCGIVILMLYLAINRHPNRSEKKYALEPEPVNEKHNVLKIPENPVQMRKIKEMKNIIKLVNERQHIVNNNNYSGLAFDHTVLVIRVHLNISYLAVFCESIRHVVGIHHSLLIFAHSYYDEAIHKAITSMRFARVMQIYYPYSIQLHPNVYPGEDSRFCGELNVCVDSKKRNPVLAQTKLFWWWVANQVFDHIGVLKSYNGYIYFMETEQYLVKDYILTAKMMEHLQPTFCSECRFLSLGAWYPRADLYRPLSSTLVVSVWGWSNYSNSGIGFNRTTWGEIKSLKEHFCYFKDPSWENSLKHLASKTSHNYFFMLFVEAPRFFPTTRCGAFSFRNGTDCDLEAIYHDVLKFIPSLRYRRFSNTFSLKFDGSMTKNEVEARGLWGDARDLDLCMFFASRGRRIYY